MTPKYVGKLTPSQMSNVKFDPAPNAAPRYVGRLSPEQLASVKFDDDEDKEDDEPSFVESAVRGAAQGASMGWSDEIEGALKSAFSDKTYRQARDEARAKNKAAQEAHPIGYGLSEILGGIGTGLATGGAAGAAGKLGAKGVAALAAGEGAISGLGTSEADLTKGQVGKAAEDTLTGAAIGGATGYGLHKIFGNYVNTAVERRARDLNQQIGEGAIPTVKRRLGQAIKPDELTGQSTAVNILDNDLDFKKALNHSQRSAASIADERLDALSKEVAPAYRQIDQATAELPDMRMSIGRVANHFDAAIAEADIPGNSRVRKALEDVRNDFVESSRRRLGLEPDTNLNDVTVPTQEVRQWVTRLLKHSTQSMGGLNETETKVVKDAVHGTAHEFLRDYLEQVRTQLPDLTPTVDNLLANNQRIRVWAATKEALDKAVERKNWSPTSLRHVIQEAGLPGIAGAIGAGADVVTGGLAYGGTKLAQMGAKKIGGAATFHLAKLVTAVRSGDVSKQVVLDALKAGVPAATVQGILATLHNRPR